MRPIALCALSTLFLGCAPINSSIAMETPPKSTSLPIDEDLSSDLVDLKSRLFTLADNFKPNVTKQAEVEDFLGVKFYPPQDSRDRHTNSAVYAHGFRSVSFTAWINKNLDDQYSPAWGFGAGFDHIPFEGNLEKCFSIHEARSELVTRGWMNVETLLTGGYHVVQAETEGV